MNRSPPWVRGALGAKSDDLCEAGTAPAPIGSGPGHECSAGWRSLAVLLWQVGTGPFLAGLRLIDAPALAAALGIGVLTTVCAAWRWSLVAGGLGVRLPLATAVGDCYRAVFLNATLPGGVLGDVHRAVRHGRDAGDVGRGIRAVVWERTAGQVVLVGVALVVLAAFPSPVRPYLPVAAGAAASRPGWSPCCWPGPLPHAGAVAVGAGAAHRRGRRPRRAARPPQLARRAGRLRAWWSPVTWPPSWSRPAPPARTPRCPGWCR